MPPCKKVNSQCLTRILIIILHTSPLIRYSFPLPHPEYTLHPYCLAMSKHWHYHYQHQYGGGAQTSSGWWSSASLPGKGGMCSSRWRWSLVVWRTALVASVLQGDVVRITLCLECLIWSGVNVGEVKRMTGGGWISLNFFEKEMGENVWERIVETRHCGWKNEKARQWGWNYEKTSHGKCHSDSNLCRNIDGEVVAMTIFVWARLWELTSGRGGSDN